MWCPASSQGRRVVSFYRNIGVSRTNSTLAFDNAKEFKIPIPYGFIAGKSWGNPDGHPIFCLHGHCDNADSFLPLGKLLSSKHHYIALDATGHGLSSHLPAGVIPSVWDLVVSVRRAMNYFKVKELSILGHSMGGSTGVMFASAYPEVVQKLMLIDIIKPVILPLPWLEQKLGTNIDSYLATEKSLADPKNRKGVPIEDLVARRVEVNNGGITPESARILMERGAKPVEGGKGLIFSHDLRMVLPHVVRFHISQHREMVKSLNCHLKILKAAQGPLYEPVEVLEEFKSYYRQYCKSFDYVEVEGTHHVHMDNPEHCVQIVDDFFQDLTL